MEIAFLMDPPRTFHLRKDSTLAMIRAAQQRGWKVSYFEQADLFLDGSVRAFARTFELSSAFAAALDPATANGEDWFTEGDRVERALTDFDIVMMRKDPPFDMEYIYSTYLLERAEAAGVNVVNRPASLRDCNEKFFATAFPQCQPPLVVSRHPEVLKRFHAEHKDVIYKPLDGMGGRSIFRAREADPNLNVIIETLTDNGQTQIMAQRYIPEIKAGDKRILMINGAPLPYALARVPAEGELRGNLAAGGTGIGHELTERDRWICSEVGPTLRERGLFFVGLDVIGDYLTEINVTSPTCIRELDTIYDDNIAGRLFDALLETGTSA